MPVIRKPLGMIKVVKEHRTPRGKVFKVGEEHYYYSIIERRECNCKNSGKKGKVIYTLYKTRKGLIATQKAIKI